MSKQVKKQTPAHEYAFLIGEYISCGYAGMDQGEIVSTRMVPYNRKLSMPAYNVRRPDGATFLIFERDAKLLGWGDCVPPIELRQQWLASGE